MHKTNNIAANSVETDEQPEVTSTRARRIRLAGRSLYIVGIMLSCAVAAHAQADPFTQDAQSWESMLTGTFAQMVTVSGIVLAGVPLVTGQGGNHKQALIGTIIGGVIVLGAQRIVSSLLPTN